MRLELRTSVMERFDWPWIEAQVAQTSAVWEACAAWRPVDGRQYCEAEQVEREKAYDAALEEVEREAKKKPRTRADRLQAQERMTDSFARFSATALDLPEDAVLLLRNDFLPVGTALARWARRFDESLSMADIIQASRNAWTACGLQPLLGEKIALTPSILGYSLMYPYSDNFLDSEDVPGEEKRRFGERFRRRLEGEEVAAANGHEAALWALVELVEGQYPRAKYAQVFECMLAIHRAQQGSIAQVGREVAASDAEVLRISCAKGGSSVLADACLARGELREDESRFGFDWGVLLQLGDDLQDVREDLLRGSMTMFSRAAASGRRLDGLASQLLSFSDYVGTEMEGLPHGSAMLKDLLRMSWRSLIVGAVADSHEFFSPEFVAEMERSSAFRFEFLRARRKRLASREGLYAVLFNAFLEAPENDDMNVLPMPVLAGV